MSSILANAPASTLGSIFPADVGRILWPHVILNVASLDDYRSLSLLSKTINKMCRERERSVQLRFCRVEMFGDCHTKYYFGKHLLKADIKNVGNSSHSEYELIRKEHSKVKIGYATEITIAYTTQHWTIPELEHLDDAKFVRDNELRRLAREKRCNWVMIPKNRKVGEKNTVLLFYRKITPEKDKKMVEKFEQEYEIVSI